MPYPTAQPKCHSVDFPCLFGARRYAYRTARLDEVDCAKCRAKAVKAALAAAA